MSERADFVVVGAGVFGAWIAHALRQRNHSVIVVDAYGAGNSRSSSGDESRIIRMGYGPDALYTRMAARSLHLWQQLFRTTGNDLFVNCGMLWLAGANDTYTRQTEAVLSAQGIAHEKLAAGEIGARFPQFAIDDVEFGIFEPESGVLLARRAVVAGLEDTVRMGAKYRLDAVVPPEDTGPRLSAIRTRSGETLEGDTFIFAGGAWLPKLFPTLLQSRLFPTRQEVFYFGAPAGQSEFRPGTMPAWLHHGDQMYGLPDIENRGVKIACDRHGEAVDPDVETRIASNSGLREARAYLRRRFPALQGAPVVETRVCQYENTCNGDFLLDRHPECENVWLAGGGSGHGFKHGPAVGEYLAGRIFGDVGAEPRFSVTAKLTAQQRAVY
jgi:monomeric sarcosine oxidase